MAQLISSSSSSEISDPSNRKLPATIPLPSFSNSSSLIGTKLPSSRDLALDTEVPLVAINFSGTSPSSNLPPPSVLTKQQAPPQSLINRQSAEFEKSMLVGLGFGSDLGIGSGSDIGRASAWQKWSLGDEDEEEGSDLGLVNVSPITYTASGMGSGIQSLTEETFARATQHLRQDSDARRKREDIDKAMSAKEEELRSLINGRNAQRPRAIERESSEDAIVVPDLRNVEMGGGVSGLSGLSAAEQRRRRRRMERRQSTNNTPVVSPEVVQGRWGRRS